MNTSKKKVVKKSVKKVVKKVVQKKETKKTESKMDKAVKIVERMFPAYLDGTKERKDVLKELQKKCDMSSAYASTAFQTIKTRILEDEMN